MNKKQYQDLYGLLREDRQAHQFFTALPDDVRQAVSWQAKDLHSINDLKNCAGEQLSEFD